ncbi:MAG: sigma 54-interacting transcriptional regulator, partial [Proteobacteria bacterium]|nr:sigma 54-interacting transcriptional regulator [Pseudomonadota bacterium]
AHQGTLFLDEIGNIPLTVQEKILRTVEYGSFERVGGSHPVEVDVRIVGATNADLPAMAREGRFKQDLLDRLSFEVLTLPPLRERRGDALVLAEHFAQRMAVEMGWSGPPEFSPAAREQLAAHPWPGNVRQLKNVVERAVYRSGGREIRSFDFDPFASPFSPLPAAEEPRENPPAEAAPPASPLPFRQAVADCERRLLQNALSAARFNQRQAAELLGLTYHQLRGLLRKHGPLDKF